MEEKVVKISEKLKELSAIKYLQKKTEAANLTETLIYVVLLCLIAISAVGNIFGYVYYLISGENASTTADIVFKPPLLIIMLLVVAVAFVLTLVSFYSQGSKKERTIMSVLLILLGVSIAVSLITPILIILYGFMVIPYSNTYRFIVIFYFAIPVLFIAIWIYLWKEFNEDIVKRFFISLAIAFGAIPLVFLLLENIGAVVSFISTAFIVAIIIALIGGVFYIVGKFGGDELNDSEGSAGAQKKSSGLNLKTVKVGSYEIVFRGEDEWYGKFIYAWDKSNFSWARPLCSQEDFDKGKVRIVEDKAFGGEGKPISSILPSPPNGAEVQSFKWVK